MTNELLYSIPKLVGIDLETTGSSFSDRIIEIALLVYEKGVLKEQFVERINPGIPIPLLSTKIHGIKDIDVCQKQSFSDIANHVLEKISNAVLFGYNIIFDFNVLSQEMVRTNNGYLDPKKWLLLDPFVIWKKHDPKTLEGAYQFFCNKPHVNSHGALADISVTFEVLEAQLKRYTDLPNEYKELCTYCYPVDSSWVCSSYHFIWDDNGEIICNFGKNKGIPLKRLFQEKHTFCDWILSKNFPEDVKELIRKVINEEPLPIRVLKA